jgi:hypothetical protein
VNAGIGTRLEIPLGDAHDGIVEDQRGKRWRTGAILAQRYLHWLCRSPNSYHAEHGRAYKYDAAVNLVIVGQTVLC